MASSTDKKDKKQQEQVKRIFFNQIQEAIEKYQPLTEEDELFMKNMKSQKSVLVFNHPNRAIQVDPLDDVIRKNPHQLPEGLKWKNLDLNNVEDLVELYKFLHNNYIERTTPNSSFRLDYQADFLKWALQPPGWRSEWHCGIVIENSNRLVGFISAIPARMTIVEKQYYQSKLGEMNFLCLHKLLREKHLSVILVREMLRRIRAAGMRHATYVTRTWMPKPFTSMSNFYRPLNVMKVHELNFCDLEKEFAGKNLRREFQLERRFLTPGFREMRKNDIDQVHGLLCWYLQMFRVTPLMNREEFVHWFMPRHGIVYSFVVDIGNEITDFVSYYSVPSTVLHESTHKKVKTAFSFYNVASKTPWRILMYDALISAKQRGFDVFSATDVGFNSTFMSYLKFVKGGDDLYYYLYNVNYPRIDFKKVGLVML